MYMLYFSPRSTEHTSPEQEIKLNAFYHKSTFTCRPKYVKLRCLNFGSLQNMLGQQMS